jgi:hypothetical protein
MAIDPLANLPEHLIDHAAIGVKTKTQNDNLYVTLSSSQEIEGTKQFNQNVSVKTEKKIIFDAS